jgi:hypothetical protein
MREQEEQGMRSYVPANPEEADLELTKRMLVAGNLPMPLATPMPTQLQQRPTGGVIASYGPQERVVTSRYGTGSATAPTGKPATFDGMSREQFFGQAAARQGVDNKYARAEKTGNPKFTSKAIPKGNTATSERIYEAIKSGSAETTRNKPSNAKPAAKNAEKPATTKRANKPIDNEDVTVTDAIMTGRMPNVAYAAPIRSEPPQASARNGEMSIDTMYETYHPEMILESARQEYARTGDDSGLREHLRRFPSEATRLSQEETQIWQQMVKEGADIEAAQQAQMAAFNEREKAIKENSFGILGSGAAARAWEAKNPEKAALLKKPLPKRDRALIEQANRKSAQFEEARKAQRDFIYEAIKKGGSSSSAKASSATDGRVKKKIDNMYGYPVVDAKELGVDDYLKSNPHVAGMAWGGGENGTDPTEKRTIVVNPYNKYMSDPLKRQGLITIEAARHLMGETKYNPTFSLTESQQEWRKGLGPYSKDDKAFKQSIVSRLMVGDEVPGATKEQKLEAERFLKLLEKTK